MTRSRGTKRGTETAPCRPSVIRAHGREVPADRLLVTMWVLIFLGLIWRIAEREYPMVAP